MEKLVRSIVSLVLAISLVFAASPVIVFAANTYTEQFDYYTDCAINNGLIPPNWGGNLDVNLSNEDLCDFIFQFARMKCGIDIDAYLNRAQATNSSGMPAKATALEELLRWDDEDMDTLEYMQENGIFRLEEEPSWDVFLHLFSFFCHKYIVSFSPLIYHFDDYFPMYVDRYSFQDVEYSVSSHPQVVSSISFEIDGLSKGIQRSRHESALTRQHVAAYAYMFSTMSLARDLSGKYPGGMSGSGMTDSFVTGILDETIRPGMTDTEKIKAIYDYLIFNFAHDSSSMPILLGDNTGDANPLALAVSLSMPIQITGTGTCDAFANTFLLLAIRLGYECNYVSGQYVNLDGTKHGHGWNQIKVNDEWYWVDVDIEGQVFQRGNGSAPSYAWFMKKDDNWVSNHTWARSDWPAADGTKHPLESYYGEQPSLGQGVPSPVQAPPDIRVIYNGKDLSFEVPPQIINDRTMVPLRAVFEEMGASVEWDGSTQTVTATKDGTVVVLTIDNTSPTVNGQVVTIDQPGIIVDGRTLAPLRFVAEAFGGIVEWDDASQTATITK